MAGVPCVPIPAGREEYVVRGMPPDGEADGLVPATRLWPLLTVTPAVPAAETRGAFDVDATLCVTPRLVCVLLLGRMLD